MTTPTTERPITVDELRAAVAYVRSFVAPGDLPELFGRRLARFGFQAGVHHVPRAALRELVAEDPGAWKLEEWPGHSTGRYFTATLQGCPDLDLCFFTEHEPVSQAEQVVRL